MEILKPIHGIIIAAALTGCSEEFDPGIEVTPALCINSLITSGEPFDINVSHTWLYSDRNAELDHTVPDAEVSVYADDKLQHSGYLPLEGDHIRIVADSHLYGHAEAEVTVPVSVTVLPLRWTPVVTDIYTSEESTTIVFHLNVEMEIMDDSKADNYYRLSYSSILPHEGIDSIWAASTPPGVSFNGGTFKDDAEPIFSEHIGVLESALGGDTYGFTFFTDRQFSGKSYTLHLQYSDCRFTISTPRPDPSQWHCGYEFTLHTISKSYYNWANYLWQRDDSPMGDISEAGFGDPIWGYSNVSTGAGIVAAQSSRNYTINLKDFLIQTLTSPPEE